MKIVSYIINIVRYEVYFKDINRNYKKCIEKKVKASDQIETKTWEAY